MKETSKGCMMSSKYLHGNYMIDTSCCGWASCACNVSMTLSMRHFGLFPHTRTHSHTLTHTHTHTHKHSHSHTHTHTHTIPLTRAHTHNPSHSITHTHSYTLTLT